MENLDKENLNALSDEELEDVTGGVFLRTLEGRVDRRSVAVFPTTLEDKTPNGKKQRRGVRVQTLENRPEDKSTAHTEWL